MTLSLQGAATAGAVPAGTGDDSHRTYAYSFCGPGISGSGTLEADCNGDGTYTACAGTGTFDFGTCAGSISTSLVPNCTGSGATWSPGAAFIYDDQLLPGTDPLSYWGLLFKPDMASGSAPCSEINIFSYDSHAYAYYDNNNGYTSIPLANFSLTAIPIPKSIWGGIGLLAAIGICHLNTDKRSSAFN